MYLVYAAIVVLTLFALYSRWWLTEPPNAPPIVRLYGTRYSAFWLTVTDPARLIIEAQKKYGAIFTLDLIFLKQTILTDADGLDLVYKTKDDTLSFYKIIKYMRGMLGYESIRERPEAEHTERADKVAATLLRHKRAFFDYIQEEVEAWAAGLASSGQVFDFWREADQLFMNVSIRCFMGKEVRDQHADTFRKLYCELENEGLKIGAFFFWWLPFGPGARCKRIRQIIAEILRPIVEERRRLLETTGEERIDYLNSFVTLPHKKSHVPWSETEMVERMLAIFFASRINSAKAFFWTTMSIATRPAILERLRADLDRQDEITFDAVEKKFNYIELCMREGVRPMYGINPGSRVAMKDIPYKGFTIPKGYVVGASSHCLSRDPSIFPEPDAFIPERWDTEPLKSNARIWAFFGAGQHKCRGEKFAILVLRTAISIIFKKYDLRWIDQTRDGQLPSFRHTVALPVPTSLPVRATLTPRHSASSE